MSGSSAHDGRTTGAASNALDSGARALPQPPREMLEKYATNAPRYTSYPTAVDWSKDFDPASYPQRLARAAGVERRRLARAIGARRDRL